MLKTTLQFQKNLFRTVTETKNIVIFCPFFVHCGSHIGIPTTIKNLTLKGPPELSKPIAISAKSVKPFQTRRQ